MSGRSVSLRVECLEERLALSTLAAGPLPQAASDQMLAGVMPILTAQDSSLTSAYTDYNGNKGAAIADIVAANAQLAASLSFVGSSIPTQTSTTPSPSTTSAPPASQAASDALLTASLPILQSAISTLQQANSDYGGHKATAIQDLIAAENQLADAIAYSAARSLPPTVSNSPLKPWGADFAG